VARVSVVIALLLLGPVAGADEGLPAVGVPAPGASAEVLVSRSRHLLLDVDNTPENLHAALASYGEALKRGLSSTAAASAYADRALALLRLGDFQKSKQERQAYYDRGKLEAEKGILADATYADAHFMRAANLGSWMREKGVVRSLFLLGDLKAGFRKTLELDPEHRRAKLSLARIDAQLPRLAGGSKKRAEQRYRTLLERDPHFTLGMIFYAEFLADQGRGDESIQWLKRILAEAQPAEPADFRRFDRSRAEVLLEQLAE